LSLDAIDVDTSEILFGYVGKIDPAPVLDLTVELTDVSKGYAAMDDRSAMKVMVRP
jgi:threonine dehydrogenase-like Zn-dependent dehydrogenase